MNYSSHFPFVLPLSFEVHWLMKIFSEDFLSNGTLSLTEE